MAPIQYVIGTLLFATCPPPQAGKEFAWADRHWATYNTYHATT